LTLGLTHLSETIHPILSASVMRSLSLIGFLAPALVFAKASGEHEGVARGATDLFTLGGFPISNSILTTWIIAILIIVGVRLAVGTPKLIPGKGQAVVEGLAQGLRDALEPIVGKQMIGKTFPLLCGFFVFILLMNWSGLLPGVGTVKYQHAGHWLDAIRPANSDLNTTLALSVVSFLAWTYFVLRYAGVRVLVFDLFGNKADRKEIGWGMWILLSFIFLGVGGIEVVSIAFRLISLSFRLFGNVFGGENLIHSLGGIAPYVIPAIAGLLEVLVGLIQAFVFTLLSAVYIGLICNHEGGHDEEHAH
jgi:F-type H+-transporting ATPase subunit a